MKTWFGKIVARKVCAAGKGNQSACNKLFIQKASLYASVSKFSFLEADDEEDHPNRMDFQGTLVILDEPSDKPPHGSQGHRILVPKQVAQENLKSLVGQGLNYSPDLDEHAPRRKVGVITDAWIDGNKVKVKGYVWKKDFPEAERDLKQGKLGMSMELANVYVRDEHADVWYLEDFVFTGATVLHRDAAAYTKTQLAASAAATSGNKGGRMKDQKAKRKAVAASGENDDSQARLLASAVGAAVKEAVSPLAKAISTLSGDMGEMKELITVQAAAKHEDDDDDMDARGHHEDDDMDAKHEDDDMDAKGKHEDDEDMDAARHEEDDEDAAADVHAKKGKQADDADEEDDSEDDDDEDDLDAALEDLEEKPAYREPGEVNKGMEKKGSKTTVTKVGAAGKPFPKLVKASRGMSASAALMVNEILATRDRKWKRAVREMQASSEKQINKLKTRLETMHAQLEQFAEQESRRSMIPVELTNLAAKSNIDLNAMRSDGAKFSADQVDQMFASAGVELGPTERIALKNRLLEQGLMDEGRIERPYNQRLQ